jgi:hypothetical protein
MNDDKTITLDVSEFHRIFDENLNRVQPQVTEKLQEHHDSARMAALNINLDDLQGAKDNYCAAWPKISSTLRVLLGMAMWVPGVGQYASLVQAWLGAYESKIHPLLCQQR